MGMGTVAAAGFCSLFVMALAGQFENVALNKSCSSSSFYSAGTCGAAVNNNTAGEYTEGHDTNCIHTAMHDYSPWWEVNLGRPYPVYNITVWARHGYVRRMQGCVISVDGAECYRFTTPPTTREIPITCSSGVLTGTVVRVGKDTAQATDREGDYTINICEVQVFSCSEDYWGSRCDSRCGQCSEGEVCDKVTGHCSSCSPGWRMPRCNQECGDGTYGPDCRETCGERCGDVCDKVTGHCTCTPGWQGSACDEGCADGSYGPDCHEMCAEGCGDVCDKVTGHCTCTPGWQGPYCDDECGDGTYGPDCRETCGERCGDVCDKVTGHCTCTPGWQGPTCGEKERKDQRTDTNEWPIVGSVIGVGVVLAVIIVIGFAWLKSRHSTSRNHPGDSSNTGNSTAGTEAAVELKTRQTASSNTSSNHPATGAENPYDCPDSGAAANNYESLEVYENTMGQDGNPGFNCFCK